MSLHLPPLYLGHAAARSAVKGQKVKIWNGAITIDGNLRTKQQKQFNLKKMKISNKRPQDFRLIFFYYY